MHRNAIAAPFSLAQQRASLDHCNTTENSSRRCAPRPSPPPPFAQHLSPRPHHRPRPVNHALAPGVVCRRSPPTTKRNRGPTAPSSTGSLSPTPTLRTTAPAKSRGPSLADVKPCVPRPLPAKEVVNSFMNLEEVEQVEEAGQLQGAPAKANRAPRAPKTAYACFTDKERETLESVRWVHTTMTPDGRLVVPDASRRAGDISREVGRRWKALSAEQRQYWQAESKKDQERYLAECAKAGVQPKVFAHMPGQVSRAARQRAGWHGQSR